MKIYVVQYPNVIDTPDVIVGYYLSEDYANLRAQEINKANPGIGCFVDFIIVE
jgi:hypothetical protein